MKKEKECTIMKKVIRIIGAILFIGAFVLAIGTAGTSDIDTISFSQVVARCFVSLLLLGTSLVMLYITD